ncbi:MAG: DNA polymerase Y family protein [Pseudomonadota bacterium]
MKRFVSIWFPDWPLTRLKRARLAACPPISLPEKPFVLVETGAHGLSVAAANTAAKECGVAVGLGFADARARAPSLLSEEIDRRADRAALRALAFWMIRVAPIIAIDGDDGIYLETTGCERYYGGEKTLLRHIETLLYQNKIPHTMALAGTPGATHALARHHNSAETILDAGNECEGLANLPCQGLRLSEEALTLLRRFGLSRIGQLYDVDRKALARRFRSAKAADAVLMRLDQALGRRNEPLVSIQPAPVFSARLPCPEPLMTSEGLGAGLQTMAEDLCAQLARHAKGAQVFTFHAFRSEGSRDAIEMATARPCADADHLCYLFRERIDHINPGFGVDHLVLHASRVDVLQNCAPVLSGAFGGGETEDHETAALADRLTSKLGPQSVAVSHYAARYLPEKAEQRRPFHGAPHEDARENTETGPRPQRLIDPPEPITVLAAVPDGPPRIFRWRRVQRRVLKADGPERLAPEWWRHSAPVAIASPNDKTARKWLTPKMDPRADASQIKKGRTEIESALSNDLSAPIVKKPRARDYYRVEDQQGRRYWLYRDGLYDDNRGGAPQWFIHGLFA